MDYLVTFRDGSSGVFPEEWVFAVIDDWYMMEQVVSYVPYEPGSEPTPTDEEILYANWQRTGGTGSMAYWQSIGSPLFYTSEPEPELQYPSTDIKDIVISVIQKAYPATDIKDIIFSVIGEEYPATDIKDVIFTVIGEQYPSTDIKDIVFNVIREPAPPPPEEPVEEKKKFPWVPAALIAGGAGLVVVAGIGTKKTKGG